MSHNVSKCYEKTTLENGCTAAITLHSPTLNAPPKGPGRMIPRDLSEIGFVRPILTNPNPDTIRLHRNHPPPKCLAVLYKCHTMHQNVTKKQRFENGARQPSFPMTLPPIPLQKTWAP